MDAEAARGVSPKTWNDTLKLVRATFKHLHPHLSDGSNPFHGLVTKATATVNREPFTVEELKAILVTCAGDDFIRPIIVTGMCTAMRRGDCCLLKWSSVDLKAGFLSVETAKTGEWVDIPLFPMFADELVKAKAKAGTSEFCFPEAALMYRSNPDGITWRVKQVLARALEAKPSADPLPSSMKPKEIRSKVDAYPATLGNFKRAAKIRAVFDGYANGATLDQVQELTGASRGTISNYFNQLERETGASIVRGKQRAVKTADLQEKRENGQRRASLHVFHSFRVTGHRAAAVVLKHYFRPGREDFRTVITQAMPKMLGHGATKSTKEQMKELLRG